jgi:hypothetical protein
MKPLFFSILAILLPVLQVHAQADHALNPLRDTSGGGPELFGRMLRFFLGFTGVAALFFMTYGGILLLTSRGNPEQIKSGKDTLMWAIIGIFVAFTSYAVLRFIIETVITPIPK